MTTLREPQWLLPLLSRGRMAGCLVNDSTGEFVETSGALPLLLGVHEGSPPPATLSEALGLELDQVRAAAEGGEGLLTTSRPNLEVLCHRADARSLVLLIRDRSRELEGRLAEESARLNASLLDVVFELVPHMLFVKDATEFRYLRANRVAEQTVGLSLQEVQGKTDFELFPKEQAEVMRAADQRAIATHMPVASAAVHVATRNGERILESRKLPVFDASGRPMYVVGIAQDITEQVRAQAERDIARKHVAELETERSMRDRFIAALSHDLRNPLAAARAWVELLGRRSTWTADCAQLSARAVDTLNRVDRMVSDLLDAGRIQAGRPLSLQLEPCDLVALVRATVDDLAVVDGNRIELNSRVPELNGRWAKEKVRRMVENLVSNGIKYGDPGGMVTVTLDRRGDRAVVSVHNDGAPIPAEEQPRIFDAFARSASAVESGKTGWGLGLMLVRGIAEAHGGAVSVQSGPGIGTTFTVVLPIMPADPHVDSPHPDEHAPAAPPQP